MRAATAGLLEAAVVRHRGFDYRALVSPPDDFIAWVALHGTGTLATAQEQVHFSRGSVFLDPIDLPFAAKPARLRVRFAPDPAAAGYLRRARLERAHRQLQAADPGAGATVAEIARRWGWASPAQFATAYRKRYGMPPSHTLRG